MAEPKEGKAAPWTDGEKIIDKGGPIQYDELILPEGRTKKAVTLMISRERQKAKQAREANGNGASGADGEETPKAAAPKKGKRKANGEAEGAPAKTKASRKKKRVKAGPDGEDAAEEDDKAPAVRSESDGDELAF